MVLAYDNDKDGNLDCKEFEKLVLTVTDSILRTRAANRYETYIGLHDKLSFEQEHHLSSLIMKEIQGLANLNKEKEALRARFDFSKTSAFQAIDYCNMGNLMREDLRKFLIKNQQYASVLDVDHLLQRLDRDQDGVITFVEFCDYFDSPYAGIE
jgi:Ca2+-binding EF-hand superfamily protein